MEYLEILKWLFKFFMIPSDYQYCFWILTIPGIRAGATPKKNRCRIKNLNIFTKSLILLQ